MDLNNLTPEELERLDKLKPEDQEIFCKLVNQINEQLETMLNDIKQNKDIDIDQFNLNQIKSKGTFITSKLPQRTTVINDDDITNLVIALNNSNSIDELINQI
jgi:hypothetical protein